MTAQNGTVGPGGALPFSHLAFKRLFDCFDAVYRETLGEKMVEGQSAATTEEEEADLPVFRAPKREMAEKALEHCQSDPVTVYFIRALYNRPDVAPSGTPNTTDLIDLQQGIQMAEWIKTCRLPSAHFAGATTALTLMATCPTALLRHYDTLQTYQDGQWRLPLSADTSPQKSKRELHFSARTQQLRQSFYLQQQLHALASSFLSHIGSHQGH